MEVQTALTTFAEFEKLPDPQAGHLELHHGEVVLVPFRKKSHMQIQQLLFDLFGPLLRGLGFITIEFAFRPAPEFESWQCDLGFVSQRRWDADHNEYFQGAPDMVIEVLSKSNTMEEILTQQEMCFASGCLSFWTVVPKQQIVLVTTPDGRTIRYDRSASVPLPEPYHGAIPVASIFQ